MTVETIAKDLTADSEEFEALIQRVDLVCVTDEARDTLVMPPLLLACLLVETRLGRNQRALQEAQ